MKKTKKSISLIMAILMVISIIPFSASAAVYSGKFGENSCLTWRYDSETDKLTISGNGAIPDYTGVSLPPYNVYLGYIDHIEIKEGVTCIGIDAFKTFSVETLDLPASVTEIRDSAFKNCYSLKGVDLSNVKVLGDSVFENCHNLKTYNRFSPELKTIGENAFKDCAILSKITLNEGIETIGAHAFHGCSLVENKEVVIPDSVTSIGAHSFQNCGISKLHIGKNVDSLPVGCFAANDLTYANIPASVDNITGMWVHSEIVYTYGAFNANLNLSTLYVEEGAALIPENAFSAGYVINDDGSNYYTKVTVKDIYYSGSPETLQHDFEAVNIHYNHKHNYEETVIESYYPCKSGVIMYTCKECNYFYYENTEVTKSHDMTWTVDVVPTCVDSGRKTHYCRVCSYSYKVALQTDPYNHVDVKVTKPYEAPTCYRAGSTEEKYCDACERIALSSVSIPPLEHKNKRLCSRAATCTTDGYENGYYCPDCKSYFLDNITVIPATGHKNTTQRNKVDSTCTSTGREAGTYCNDCKKWIQGGATINKKAHNYGDWYIIDPANCVNKRDLKERKCADCGATTQQGFSSNNPGHKDDNRDGKCDNCNWKMTILCLCSCHKKDGKGNGWYRFCLFFWKLFKTNKTCKCGATHY